MIIDYNFLLFQYLLFDKIQFQKLYDYKNSILKPINNYTLNMCIPPEIVKIDRDGYIQLRQKVFAQIWIHYDHEYNNRLDIISRPAIQQFVITEDCEREGYHSKKIDLQIQWFLDYDGDVIFKTSEEESAFEIEERTINLHRLYKNNYVERKPEYLSAFIKKDKDFDIYTENAQTINRLTPAFDIFIKYNKDIEERLNTFYGKNTFSPHDGTIVKFCSFPAASD
jgi:hypothetical protein